ncbi:MAG: rhodanese-like domain-containing protein [Spirochaetota bacterium]
MVHYKRLITKYISVIIILSALTSCGAVSRKSPRDIHRMITDPDMRQEIVLVDIRGSSEYADGHIPGAIHIPFRSKKFDELLYAYSDTPVLILYCGRGLKTEKGAQTAKKSGFTQIYILEGGFSSWKDRGLPVTSD